MTTIPAKIAGVKDISITCPVSQNGLPPESVLAAAHIAGVRNVYCVGGAQSIAAFAYGTESISKVDIICGPGNIFVTLAKKIVYGDVGIDGLYGPTETLIIADDSANPSFIASDLLAQAEHDKQAKPILITTSMRIATEVEHELALKLERLSRKDIAQISTQNEGIIAIVETIQDAIKLSNTFGPEHLCLATSYPEEHLSNVTNAGMIFLGDFSHEVLGDYGAGPSHVMPTAGTARFNSGLGIHTFQKIIPIVGINKPDSLEIGQIAAIIAKEEGLTAHAEAAEIRQEFI
jgi:histidinol dehydrogenase